MEIVGLIATFWAGICLLLLFMIVGVQVWEDWTDHGAGRTPRPEASAAEERPPAAVYVLDFYRRDHGPAA